MVCPLMTLSDVLSLACQFVSEDVEVYMLTIKRLFEQASIKIEWNLNAENCSNLYNFIPFLLKRFDKTRKKAENVAIAEWLSLVGSNVISKRRSFAFLYVTISDQNLNLTCSEAMRVIGGEENWAFRYAAFHLLNLRECKYEIPLSMYKAIPKECTKDYVCIMDDEDPSYEKYLEHFFELILIANTVPDELMVGITSTYRMEEDFLSLVSKIGYRVITEVKNYYRVEINKLFTTNLGRLYCALGQKLDKSSIFEKFCSVSMRGKRYRY